jgi:hypothetical protein
VAGKCADAMPLPVVLTMVFPDALCRGASSGSNNLEVSVDGDNFDQVTGITSSLAGVTASIKPLGRSNSHMDLSVDIAAGSALGAGDLVFHRAFGPPNTFAGALTVNKFDVTTITPASGARGASVAVTIKGSCFDTASLIQQVNASGIGIDVINLLVADDETLQCVFDIKALAPATQRDVTVKIGTESVTKLNAFTVT